MKHLNTTKVINTGIIPRLSVTKARFSGLFLAVAPAALGLILAFSGTGHTAMDPAKYKGCIAASAACFKRCNQVYVQPSRVEACMDRCMDAETKCFAKASTPGKLDAGGTPANPSGANTTPKTGGIFHQQ